MRNSAQAYSGVFQRIYPVPIALFLMLQPIVVSQYLESDPRYALKKAENQEAQQGQLRSHEELIMSYQPGLKVSILQKLSRKFYVACATMITLLLRAWK